MRLVFPSAQGWDARFHRPDPLLHSGSAMDRQDMTTIRSALVYMRDTMEQWDIAHTSAGEPGIMAQMSDKAITNMIALAGAYCRSHPKMTVRNAAAFSYRGMRDLEMQFGNAK